MLLPREFSRSIPALARWVGLSLLLLGALACGGDASGGQTPGSGTDASPVFSATPQPAAEPSGAGDASGTGPVGISDKPSIANPAVGDGQSTAGVDPGGNLATEPGIEPLVSGDSTGTWAPMPGVDPAQVNDTVSVPGPTLTFEAPSERPPDAPEGSGADVLGLARGNAEFGFGVYRELSASDGNLFYSPHSISSALAMTYAGARGDTEIAMADTLRFSLPQERLHHAFDALGRDLAGRSAGDDKARFRLNAANAVWAQDGHPFLDSYLDLVRDGHGAEVGLADFASNPDGSRSRINRWVSDETEGKVQDLVPPGLIDALTRMVLVNAVYFNAGWLYPFDEHLTTREPFRLLDGGTVDVEMMRATEYFGYAAADGYQAVALPYVGGELSMTVLLPDQERFREIEDRLDGTFASRLLGQLSESYVALDLPRFEFDSAFRLGETLKAMGMFSAFDAGAADFSGMDGLSCARGDDGCLYIADVVHKAFVSVDEAGTEAAAATGVVIQTESAKPRPVVVRVDRPFIFLIRDRSTGTALFLGRVTEP